MAAKILIVDDDGDIRSLIDHILLTAGYATAFAGDAVSALTVVRREQPDLILLDIGLPGGDGYVVMQRLAAIPALSSIPVVVVSARDPQQTRRQAELAGAAGFVAKPFDRATLLGAVQRSLREPAAA